MAIALECKDVDVRFGAVHALKNVSLRLETGKIHALLGQNGAGKSTIARVMSGVLAPQNGTLEIMSNPVATGSAADAQAAGLDIVHQRFALPPTFQVGEALEFASARKMGGAVFSKAKTDAAWAARLRAAGIDVDPRTRLADLPVETVQSIEIVRALANDADVLILDEPTALLSPRAIQDLFSNLRELRDRGVTLIVVLHKLKEVMEIADTVSILRQGALVMEPTPTPDLTADDISQTMIGDVTVAATVAQTAPSVASKEVICSFSAVNSPTKGGEIGLQDVSFDLHAGEVLGVAGIEGNGQRALAEVFAGLTQPKEGQLSMNGISLEKHSVADRRALGLRAVPFDRMTEGAGLTLSLWENTMSWVADRFRRIGPIVSTTKMQAEAAALLDSYGVIYNTPAQEGLSLSGGNLQRVILARELTGNVKAVLAAQPTRGLDFNATNFVWQELNRVRSEGAGVILLSSDLDELFGICDRILVMRGGAVAGVFAPEFSASQIGAAMVGAG